MTVRSAYDDNMKPYIYEGNMKPYGRPQGCRKRDQERWRLN